MQTRKLSDALSEAHARAPEGNKVLSIHLFGIKYASELALAGVEHVVKASAVPFSYRTELRKGMKIAPYVKLIS